ncbi:MAG: NrsF family protein [bacterium]
MKRESTDRLTEELVADLSPVQRIPRLRSAFAVILAVWAALLGVVLGSSHAGASNPSFGALTRDTVYLASFLGLLVAAVGGAISALAAGVPGRERIELGGLTAAWVGLMAAAIACLSGVGASRLHLGGGLESHAMCFNKGLYLSLLPAGVILSFLVRGWTAHPLRAASVALLASGALGVLIVHLGCGVLEPRHLLIGHLSVPIVLAALGFYPLALILRRLRR